MITNWNTPRSTVLETVLPAALRSVPDATWVAVLTLLILQTSFLLPPFGYAVLMLRNRLGRNLDGGRFVRALLPYLLAQFAVLVIVLTLPTLLWHDRAPLAPPAVHALPDKEVGELLRRQTEHEVGRPNRGVRNIKSMAVNACNCNGQ